MRRPIGTLATLILTVSSCGGREPAPHAPPDTTSHPIGLAKARAPSGRTWKVGGLDGCALGASLADCEQALGTGIRSELHRQYVTFKQAGVELVVLDNKVDTIRIFYRVTDTAPFDGADPHGVGAKATQEEVMHAYGGSPKIIDKVPSEPGVRPKERELTYSQHGLHFTFYDDALAVVAIYAAEPLQTRP